MQNFRTTCHSASGVSQRRGALRAFGRDRLRWGNGSRLLRCQTGATAVEFALIAMPLIMVTFGALEFGRALWVKNTMAHRLDRIERGILILLAPHSSAAQDLCGGKKPYVHCAAGRQHLINTAGGDAATVTISAPEVITRDTIDYSFVTVRVTQTLQLAIPFFNTGSYTIRIERKVIVPTY